MQSLDDISDVLVTTMYHQKNNRTSIASEQYQQVVMITNYFYWKDEDQEGDLPDWTGKERTWSGREL